MLKQHIIASLQLSHEQKSFKQKLITGGFLPANQARGTLVRQLYPAGLVPLKEVLYRMSQDETEDTTIYKVVVNHEEQYSIWPADRENPLGWRDDGKSGLKQECLDYIKEVWTDMRPLSLRKYMEEQARQQQPFSPISQEER